MEFRRVLLRSYQKGDDLYSTYTYNAGVVPQRIEKIDDYVNGTAYELIGEEASALMPETRAFKTVMTAKNPLETDADFFTCYLHQIAKFVPMPGSSLTVPAFNFMQGARFVAFFPTYEEGFNKMIEDEMMFINENRAANALKYLYINIDKSNVVDYPFPGSGVDAEFPTFLTDAEGEVVNIRLVDNNGQ